MVFKHRPAIQSDKILIDLQITDSWQQTHIHTENTWKSIKSKTVIKDFWISSFNILNNDQCNYEGHQQQAVVWNKTNKAKYGKNPEVEMPYLPLTICMIMLDS